MRSSTTAFHSVVRTACLAFACAAACSQVVHATDLPGLRTSAEDPSWSRLAARVSIQTAGPSPAESELGTAPIQGLDVLGDLYFGPAGRFRATGGLFLGTHAFPWPSTAAPAGIWSLDRHVSLTDTETRLDASDISAAATYLGFGYSADGSYRGGWGFTADVGLLALAPQPAVRLGRVFMGQQGLDDILRELRLTPSVQIGMSYAF